MDLRLSRADHSGVGMILSASSLRKTRNVWLVSGLIVSAIASTYTQLLYAMMTAAAVPTATGVEWLGDRAIWVINVRVLILPALLPALAVVYAFAAKTGNDKEPQLYEEVNAIRHGTARMGIVREWPRIFHCAVCSRTGAVRN
jgi:hypothetical protein